MFFGHPGIKKKIKAPAGIEPMSLLRLKHNSVFLDGAGAPGSCCNTQKHAPSLKSISTSALSDLGSILPPLGSACEFASVLWKTDGNRH